MVDDDPNGGATLVVELTPVGRGAVAVVLVAGPRATGVVGELFRPVRGGTLDEIPLQRIVLGRWNSPDGEELIVCREASERVEIHCHGGVAAVGAVIDSLVARGCRHLTWQEWVQLDGRDPVQVAARVALAEAATARTAAILLDQYQGALAAAVNQAIEAARTADWALAAEVVNRVLSYRDAGEHLTRPWRVVLTGRTNVGKSSLINALAGFERAIVSHLPGTTRDVVTTVTAIDGWPVQLLDTAGLRETDDELESAGVRLAVQTLHSADLLIAVEDAAAVAGGQAPDDTNELSRIIGQQSRTKRVIRVHHKIDLLTPVERAAIGHTTANVNQRSDCDHPTILTSAVTGAGIADLVAAIGRSLVPDVPPPGAAVPFTSQQIAAFAAARAACDRCDVRALMAALQPLLARVKGDRS